MGEISQNKFDVVEFRADIFLTLFCVRYESVHVRVSVNNLEALG